MIQITDSIGIVVLNPESDPSSLRVTVKTAKDNFPQSTIKCIVGKKNAELDEIKKHCPVVIGGETITSLIDAGLKSTKQKWCFVVTTGTFFRYSTFKKYEWFCTSENDVMFPVVDRKWAFDEATINGLLLPTKILKDVGPMEDVSADIQLVKLMWCLEAMKKNYRFMGLVGARLV